MVEWERDARHSAGPLSRCLTHLTHRAHERPARAFTHVTRTSLMRTHAHAHTRTHAHTYASLIFGDSYRFVRNTETSPSSKRRRHTSVGSPKSINGDNRSYRKYSPGQGQTAIPLASTTRCLPAGDSWTSGQMAIETVRARKPLHSVFSAAGLTILAINRRTRRRGGAAIARCARRLASGEARSASIVCRYFNPQTFKRGVRARRLTKFICIGTAPRADMRQLSETLAKRPGGRCEITFGRVGNIHSSPPRTNGYD
ncbi:hypothetical protein EVAR_70591_1 [Eumeta japonica]|uniref:Uncharacterized protein n=1 Tax=Eumeta variegata TaxID=151549 RepID=A0A4C2AE32_EUMVA|nr:hypothetical protein EVAR_70591_1 [Eumeta japonica]